MLKHIVIVASSLLLFSPAAFAGNVQRGSEGSEADACYAVGASADACSRSSACKWDVVDGRCEPVSGGYCSQFHGPPDCDAASDCVWDGFEGRCEHI